MFVVGPVLAGSFGPSLEELPLELDLSPLIVHLPLSVWLPALPLPLVLQLIVLVPELPLPVLEPPTPVPVIRPRIHHLVPPIPFSLILLVHFPVVLAAALHDDLDHDLVLVDAPGELLGRRLVAGGHRVVIFLVPVSLLVHMPVLQLLQLLLIGQLLRVLFFLLHWGSDTFLELC